MNFMNQRYFYLNFLSEGCDGAGKRALDGFERLHEAFEHLYLHRLTR